MVSLFGAVAPFPPPITYLTLKKAFHRCQDLRLHGIGVDFWIRALFPVPTETARLPDSPFVPLPSISIPHLKPGPSPSGIWSESTGCRLPKQSLYLY